MHQQARHHYTDKVPLSSLTSRVVFSRWGSSPRIAVIRQEAALLGISCDCARLDMLDGAHFFVRSACKFSVT